MAPDFTIQGASEQLIDVPPEDYSKRLAFLLAPKRVGYCRINIEVYSAADAVYLGSLAIEAEALVTLHAEPERHVADLVLGVGVAAKAAVEPVATLDPGSANEPIAREAPARRASIREDVARRRREELARLLELARLSLDAGLTERAGRYREEALVLDPDHAEVLAVYERACSATAQGRGPDTAIVMTTPVMPGAPSTDAMPRLSSHRGMRRLRFPSRRPPRRDLTSMSNSINPALCRFRRRLPNLPAWSRNGCTAPSRRLSCSSRSWCGRPPAHHRRARP